MAKRKKRKMTAAEKEAFVARMARARKGGHRKKSTKRRARRAHTNTPAVANKPKARRRYARRNPPVPVITETLREGGAAIVGGLVAYAALALLKRAVSDPTAQDIGSVVLPALVGAAATQFNSPQAKAVAAGAFGVAGVGLARAVSAAVVARTNPPMVPWDWSRNPPLPPDRLIAGSLPSAFASPLRA